jgi:acylphosphatase
MSNSIALHAIVHGHVQGVFFRAFVATKAGELALTGYVRNLPSGKDVEVHAEGEKEKLNKMIDYLKIGSPAAAVEKVMTTWLKSTGKYADFSVKD